MGMTTYTILGYTGRKSKVLADEPIRFNVDDMQVTKDMQLIAGHMLGQWLYANQPGKA